MQRDTINVAGGQDSKASWLLLLKLRLKLIVLYSLECQIMKNSLTEV